MIPFSLGLFPPLTINNIEKRRKVINRGAINLILGRAHKIHGVELSSGANWTLEDVRGAQLSAAVNVVGRHVHGWQATAGVNVVGGDVFGVQGSGGVNVVRGNFGGLQATGGVNVVAGKLGGLQASGGFNWAHTVVGAQLSSINASRRLRGARIDCRSKTVLAGGRPRRVPGA